MRLPASACVVLLRADSSAQAAAEDVAREHSDGIDFLIVNAGVVDSQHKSGIAT